jgi:predicted esterase
MKFHESFPIAILFILLSGCSPQSAASVPVMATAAPTIQATLSIKETSAVKFDITDFSAVHAPVNGDANEHLIFGNLPVMLPASDIPADLSVFLGRWEGYSFAPPVKKDRKLVLQIAEISEQGGKLYGWTGTNLQFPDEVAEVHFRVVRKESPTIEFQMTWIDGSQLVASFTYDKEKEILRGQLGPAGSSTPNDVYELTRGRSFFVYKDYAKYLAGKQITTHEFHNLAMAQYSKGYMLYLPEGYGADSKKTWPLIFFFHGSGDRGKNLLLLAKASPFMYIREKGPLQAIIAAPLLKKVDAYSVFPEEFMDGALDEILADYRVDAKRVYLTGMSLGGEATYRFALHRPDVFAAISPLCAFMPQISNMDMKSIKDIPVWAFHGADDTVVKLSWGKQPVDALKAAGGNVKFTVLPNHDHDVWTDTYSDPPFYDWLLAQKKP